jgi:hypothetical protein
VDPRRVAIARGVLVEQRPGAGRGSGVEDDADGRPAGVGRYEEMVLGLQTGDGYPIGPAKSGKVVFGGLWTLDCAKLRLLPKTPRRIDS